MYHRVTPDYLNDLIPGRVSDQSSYNLRNNHCIQTINCRTQRYSQSFLPSAINSWNSLPADFTNAESINQFKSMLSVKNNINHLDLNLGSRFCQIIHCRLKLECSDLNADRYRRYIYETSECSCGHHYEDATHYLFICPNYQNLRSNMFFYANGYNIKTTPYGNEALNKSTNTNILNSLHQFILKSKRFHV